MKLCSASDDFCKFYDGVVDMHNYMSPWQEVSVESLLLLVSVKAREPFA